MHPFSPWLDDDSYAFMIYPSGAYSYGHWDDLFIWNSYGSTLRAVTIVIMAFMARIGLIHLVMLLLVVIMTTMCTIPTDISLRVLVDLVVMEAC